MHWHGGGQPDLQSELQASKNNSETSWKKKSKQINNKRTPKAAAVSKSKMWYLVGPYPNWISGGKQGKVGECGLTEGGTGEC